MAVECTKCGKCDWKQIHKSPIEPAEDRFRCNACGHQFRRYDPPERQLTFREQIDSCRKQAGNTICLFHIGDFYEVFDDDARYCARTLGLTLVSRNPKGQPEWPMTGFPYHQLESYIAKLIASGKRVAVCEQMENGRIVDGRFDAMAQPGAK